jgi:hypothetical protein
MTFQVQADDYEGTDYAYVTLRLRIAEENEGAVEVNYRCRLDDVEVDELIDALAAARDESRQIARAAGWDPDAEDSDVIEVVQGRTAD